jgi:uncharacterized protein
LIKPSGPDCNLACEYCFYLKNDCFPPGAHRMTRVILRETVYQMMNDGGPQLSFGWQGGEPTLMGLAFFEQAVRYQAQFGRSGQVVGNGLQTNGLLIDQSWAAFLREHQFLVGLSLDGPEHIHNRYRGQSWHQVVRARDLLLNAGVAVNALIVVNAYSVQFPREIYDFHKKAGLNHLQFIPCLEPSLNGGTTTADFSISADRYAEFLCEWFDLWRADFRYGQPRIFIRWFDSLFYTYVGWAAPECTLLPECGNYLVVEHNGDVYSCDFFVNPDWHLGNVTSGRLIDFLNSPRQTDFGILKSQWPVECGDCSWFRHCHGGCPRERRFSPAGSNHLCAAWKIFFRHADPFFKTLAEKWQVENSARRIADQ